MTFSTNDTRGSSASTRTSSKCHHATIWVGAKTSSCPRTISKGTSIISKVFNVFSKVVASRFKLMGTGTLSIGYKVLQSTNRLCKGSRHCRWDLVASMKSRGATTSSCWHQWQFRQQSPPFSLMTKTHAPPVTMLSFCLHLSPFGINSKGCSHTCVWNI